jgi:hypothetical protein
MIMTKIEKIVAALDAIDSESDPELAHSKADDLLLQAVSPQICDAYKRVVKRARWWAAA